MIRMAVLAYVRETGWSRLVREEPFVLASQASGQHSAGDGLLKKQLSIRAAVAGHGHAYWAIRWLG